MSRGKYIALEGICGVGKTTVGKIVVASISARGLDCHWTHDPEHHGLGQMILEMWPRRHSLGGSIWPLLHAASSINSQRRDGGHLDLLSDGAWIVTDRCALSTMASFLEEDDENAGWILELHREYVPPDLVVRLDLDPATAAARAAARDHQSADSEGARKFKRRYDRAIRIYQTLGWNIVNCRVGPGDSANDIAASILNLLDGEWPAENVRRGNALQ